MKQEHDSGDTAVDEADDDADVYSQLHHFQHELNETDPLVPAKPKRVRRLDRNARAKFAIAAVAASALAIGGAAVLMTANTSDVTAVVIGEEEPSAGEPITPAPQVVLDNATLPFKEDTAQLTDPQEAKSKLILIARSVASSSQQITLTGTTATDGTEAGRAALSLARAEAVKSILVDLGVAATRITTEGVGINHPSHVNDLDENHNLIADKAANNRTVILTTG